MIVLAGITVMMILITAAAPTWRYLSQDDKEQELFFRGDQIARGIEEYQRKNGNTFPPSLDVLVKGKYLRRQYKDPMSKDGKWRLVRPGEAVSATGTAGGGVPGIGSGASGIGSGASGATGGLGPSPRPSASPSPSAFGPGSGAFGGTGGIGLIAGVASTSRETSLRMFNGRTKYEQWIFLAVQPRRLGKIQGPGPAGSGIPGAQPSGGSRPLLPSR